MLTKATKAIVTVCLTLILFAASLLAVVPVMSINFIDFSNPSEARWEHNDDGDRYPEVNFEVWPQDTLPHFYETVNPPYQPELWQIPLISLGLGLVFLFGVLLLSRTDREKDGWIVTVVAAQFFLWMLCLGVALATKLNFDSIGAMQAVIADQELANEASSKVAQDLLSGGLVLAVFTPILFLVFDGIALLVALGMIGGGQQLEGYLREQVRRSIGLAIGDRTFLAFRGASVEMVRMDYEIRWRLVPLPIIYRHTISSVSFDEFFELLIGGSVEAAFEELRDRLLASYKQRLGETGARASVALAENLRLRLREGLDEEVKRLKEGDSTKRFEAARALLQSTSDKTLDRFQQDIAAGVWGVVETTINTFREQLLSQVHGPILGARNSLFSEGPVETFPEGTKFYLSSGELSVVVVEQKPQVRTVFFDEGFLREEGGIHGFRIDSLSEQVEGYRGLQLAFPYVVFLVRLWRGEYDSLFVFFSKKPLSSLDEQIFLPNLPNTDYNGHVCLGMGEPEGFTVSTRVQEIITHFWQSQFNNDMRERNYDRSVRCDDRVQNVARWQEESREDPSFILDVDWNPAPTILRRFVQDAAERDDQDANLRDLIYQALEQSSGQAERAVKQYLSNISVKGRYPKTVVNSLDSHLTELSRQLLDRIAERFHEIARDGDPSLHRHFNKAVIDTIGRVLAEDFGQVPIRCRIGEYELLEQLRAGTGR